MKVRELLALLQGEDPEAEVVVVSRTYSFRHAEVLERGFYDERQHNFHRADEGPTGKVPAVCLSYHYPKGWV